MEKYKISIIDSIIDWEKLSQAWNELLIKSSSQTIFLTWDWLFSWAECYLSKKRQLFILAVYRDDELIGIAPWYIHHIPLKIFTLKQIEFLGTPECGSDYLDVIIKKGREKEVTIIIYNFLLKETPSLWDCMNLRDIPSNSLFLLHFLNKIEEEGKYAEIRQGSFCPVLFLPERSDDLFSNLSSHRKQQYKRDLKILNKEHNVVQYSLTEEKTESVLDDFISFYMDKKDDGNEQFLLFLRRFTLRCKEKNWVQIDILNSGTKNIACLFHLCYQDTLSLYLMVTDKTFNPKISIGNILVGRCVEKAINQGFSIYDFLKGAEDYKFRWANGGQSSINLFFCQRKLIPVLFFIKNFFKYIAKVILR